MSKIAIIQFPGTNCEQETKRAVEKTGMQAEIVRWNDATQIGEYDGFVLPGGWSYEDRVRAGVVAAKDEIIDVIKEEASKGKPVLGICNGCQILVESGMVPDVGIEQVEMGLAPNKNPVFSGFYCTWVYVKNKRKTAFTLFDEQVLPMPIAHAEGRFLSSTDDVVRELKKRIVFAYTTKRGEEIDAFPINPNGSLFNSAGVSNEQGNVLALMPHPERAAWQKLIPGFTGTFSDGESAGPGLKLFESMKRFIENGNIIR